MRTDHARTRVVGTNTTSGERQGLVLNNPPASAVHFRACNVPNAAHILENARLATSSSHRAMNCGDWVRNALPAV